MIATNTTSYQIFITTKWTQDPSGGPAKVDTQYCISPGQSIDLSILGLEILITEPSKPLNRKKSEV